MEGRPADTPLKVCPRCSVASRTEAETCPACGRPYRRRLSVWWLAIPIVALACAVGYGGRKLIEGDEAEPGTIALQTGQDVELGISRPQLDEQLGGEDPALVRRRGSGKQQATCVYYLVTDREGTAWEFCFVRDELASSLAIGDIPQAP